MCQVRFQTTGRENVSVVSFIPESDRCQASEAEKIREEASHHPAKTQRTELNATFASVLRLITAGLLSKENTVLKARLASSSVFLKLVLDIKHHHVIDLGQCEEGSLRFQEKTFSTAEFKHVIACHAISISCLMKETPSVQAWEKR